jgi:hypothetical protein
VYRVTVDEQVQDQLDAMSLAGLAAWRELRTTLELTPGNGRPLFPDVPDGLHTFVFGEHGEGLAYYLIIDHDRHVAVVEVQWFD